MQPLATRTITSLPPTVPLARFMQALKFGDGFAERFRDTPQVSAALGLRQKAAVSGMALGHAPSLADLGILDLNAVRFLEGTSAFEAARMRMRETSFSTPTPAEVTAGTAGAWVGEGNAKPVRQFLYGAVALDPTIAATLYVTTDTLLRSPRAEAILGRSLLNAVGRTETALFLDPASTASGTAPGSITSSGTEVIGGATVAATLGDMLAAVTTSGAGATWFANPLGAAFIAAQLGVAVDTLLLGLPLLRVTTMPRDLVVLVDLAEVVFAADELDVVLGRQASIEMDDAPVMSAGASGTPSGPVGSATISLFQTNCTAFRAARALNWAAASGCCAWSLMNAGTP